MQTLPANNPGQRAGTSAKTINQLPGPASLPLLGNLLQVTPEQFHRNIQQWSDRYGPVFKIMLGPSPVIVLTSPEAVGFVLKNRPEKFRRMGKMDDIIREMGFTGVFNAEGDDWRRQRRLVAPALNLLQVKSFFPAMVTITGKLFDRWNKLALANRSIDIKSELMRYTVDVTSKLAFGYNMNTIEKKDDIIQQHLEIIFPALFKRINSPVPYWRYFKLPADRKLERSLHAIRKIIQEIIVETKEQLVRDAGLQDHPANFLQALLTSSGPDDPVSNQEIFGNVFTMLLAGEDTTAHTLAWILYYMHLHPAVQQRMQQEADTVIGSKIGLQHVEDAAKLVYTEAVAFEAMRLRPVAPVLFHNALEEVVIAGTTVPKGTGIIIQTQYAATDAAHFSHPEQFIPERWLAGGCPAHNVHNQHASIPFGSGPRFCPGYHLAMTEIKAVLAMVCKNFTVTMEANAPPVEEVLAFTMMPADFFIKLVKRK